MHRETRKKLWWALFLSFSFMTVLLYLVDWSHFSGIAGRIRKKDLIFAFCLLLLANIVRSLRFYTLDHKKNRFLRWLIINKVHNLMTATLPGGVGEAATAFILRRHTMFSMLGAIRILLLSRIMDTAGFSALLLIVAAVIGSSVHFRETSIWISAALLLVSIVALVPSTERYALKLAQKLPGQNRFAHMIRDKLDDLLAISEEGNKGRTFYETLIQTAFIIAVTAVSMHYILRSFEAGLTPMQSFYCVAVYAILLMIPIQGIAGIGTQPARWVVALNLAGYEGSDAVALSIFLHGTFYLFIAIMGMFALLAWLMKGKSNEG